MSITSSYESWNQVDDSLYIGDLFAISDPLIRRSIGTIISMIKVQQTTMIPRHVIHIEMPIDDSMDQSLREVAPLAYKHIMNSVKEGRRVLVHCHAGKSRSAAIVIYYLMNRYGKSFEDALAYLKLRRPGINPNMGFCIQLANLSV